ncbi:MAG: transcriptional regulator [Bryobacterales bacterium]|nr:transcriptional regulator [Bryobacterales bacterium]
MDNGRALGYDNSHNGHHRHFMGNIEPVKFEGYSELFVRFEKEVRALWKKEEEDCE